MNAHKTLIAGAMTFAVSVAAAAEYTVSWQKNGTPATVADGKVSLSYDGIGAITAMYVTEPVERLVFTGGEMLFAPAAEIQHPADTLVFSNLVRVTQHGGVKFTKTVNDLVYGSLETGTPTTEQKAFMIPTANPVLVFPGYGLDEIELICGSMQGKEIGSAREGRPFNPKPADDGSIVVQMQTVDGTYLKCVRIRLFQSPEGVCAQAVDACYGYTDNVPADTHQYTFGDDFDVYPGTDISVCEPPGYGGAYGVKGLRAKVLAERPFEVEISAPFMVDGEVQVENAVLKLSGFGAIGTDPETAPAMTLNRAGVEWSDMRNSVLTLAGAISGTDSELAFAQPHPQIDVNEEVVVDQAVQNTAVKIASGVSLDDIAGFKDANLYQAGNLIGEAIPCFFERLEDRIRCQFQSGGDTTWNKCAMMEFTESDGNLYARTEMSYWQYKSQAPAGEYDFRVQPYAGSNDYNYYPKKFTVVLRAPVYSVRRFVVNANAQNGLSNSVIRIGTNATFSVNHQNALPNKRIGGASVNAKTEVLAGGSLHLNIAGPDLDNGLNAGNIIAVRRGGTLIQSFGNAFGRGQKLIVDGGRVELMEKPGTRECGCYFNNLVFSNGGRLTKGGPRVGFSDACWWVFGTGAACTNEVVVALEHYPTSPRPSTVWTLNVEDVTGDESADLVFRGRFIDYQDEGSNGYYGLVRRKLGAGTLLIDEDLVSTAITGRWEIAEGTVTVAGSDQLSADRGYSLALEGGTLELKEGTENSVAYFTDLAATSGITLGENARLELPGAPTNWADDAIWQVTLGRKAKLRVGTDSSSLSPEQLKRIRVNGHGAHLDDDGYFLPVSGLLFFVR